MAEITKSRFLTNTCMAAELCQILIVVWGKMKDEEEKNCTGCIPLWMTSPLSRQLYQKFGAFRLAFVDITTKHALTQ